MRLAGCIVGLAALSLFLPAAPGYDAWAWLLWGREVGTLSLDTVGGPAWKPLPVGIAALLAPAGGLAPDLWLAVARAGALAAVALAACVAWRLAAAAPPAIRGAAAGLAAVGVLLTGGFVRHAAVGDAEPLLVALVLGAFALALDGRHRAALGVGALAALVRPETWPFLALYGLWRWREDPVLIGALAVAVPAAWVVPELLASGELLRSADRARIPNPGQPATAAVPALATVAAATGVVFAPATVAALGARGRAALPALAGAAWIGLVALMSQAGFSGEPRYVLPGAALVAVSGGAGLAALLARSGRSAASAGAWRRLPAALAAAAILAALPFAATRLAELPELGRRLAHQNALAQDLERAITAAGGRDAILACGPPAVGRYRGTLLAWHLDVPKRTVLADGQRGAVTFRSRLTPDAAPAPAPHGRPVAVNARWDVTARCAAPNAGVPR